MTTDTVSREAQIVYITEWAARFGATLQIAGEVGFGRECTGVLKGDHYPDTGDVKYGGDWWEPEDSYHKHDCLCVLGRGESALAQLYEWVKWLDGHGYGIEESYRQPENSTDLALHGISQARVVKLPAGGGPDGR